jgi:sigma-B regulation protein RsbU (phosphoserine phosphatase)
MRRLNKNLCHDSRSGQFVSLFCGVLDPARRIVSYTNAGHNPPLIIRGGRAEPLEKGGMVLGADLGEDYEQADVPLRRGDLLVLYTDGVTEALNDKGEIFGLKRLLHLVRRVGDAGADEIVKRVFATVREFAAGAPQSDDISLIVLRVE